MARKKEVSFSGGAKPPGTFQKPGHPENGRIFFLSLQEPRIVFDTKLTSLRLAAKCAKPLETKRMEPLFLGELRHLGKLGFFFGKSRAYTCPCAKDTGFSRARMARDFSKVLRGDASEATGTAADASPQTEKSRDAYPLAGNNGQRG